ncbi:MAG: septum formation initiator family protein [Omnitrophica bacterium]|nr:septum formation initiator family protein [Candidatus Omnitrophota bacterium]
MAKKRLIYILIAVFVFGAIFLPGFSKLQELKEENRNLGKRIEILKKTNKELREEKEKLENDPTYIEKIAREKLGMARKGEIILR